MKKLFFLLGVHGCGKATVLESLSENNDYKILTTSTTKESRHNEEKSYEFISLKDWKSSDYAYEVKLLEVKYGLKKSKLSEMGKDQIGLTVFHPLFFDKIDNIRNELNFIEIITIGLDTVETIAVQKNRVGNDSTLVDTQENFDKQREFLKKCDINIKGDKATIVNAIISITNIVSNKGVLADRDIHNIIKANSLLQQVEFNNIKPASYDLRLGNEIWENGKRKELNDDCPAISIQPYSYIIAISEEKAYFPKFITARFDLKVSLFLDGVILSAAPQIEPGYSDGKICSLLFNASDRPVSLKRGDHFATLEFSTTSYITKGYKEQHQGQEKISEHMEAHTFKGPGSNILSRLKRLESWKRVQIIGAITILIFLGGICATNLKSYYDVKSEKKDINVILADISKKHKEIITQGNQSVAINKIKEEIEKLKKKIKDLEKTITP